MLNSIYFLVCNSLIMFLALFSLKVLGVIVHYYYASQYAAPLWILIALLIVFLNVVISQAIKMPLAVRLGILLFSLAAAWFYIVFGQQFICLALAVFIVNVVAGLYSRNLSRIGFFAVAGSSLFWVVARQLTNAHLGYELPIQLRYDNDVYHLLLIVSTFIIYKAVAKGEWRYPD